jgi:hypothetical protein
MAAAVAESHKRCLPGALNGGYVPGYGINHQSENFVKF